MHELARPFLLQRVVEAHGGDTPTWSLSSGASPRGGGPVLWKGGTPRDWAAWAWHSGSRLSAERGGADRRAHVPVVLEISALGPAMAVWSNMPRDKWVQIVRDKTSALRSTTPSTLRRKARWRLEPWKSRGAVREAAGAMRSATWPPSTTRLADPFQGIDRPGDLAGRPQVRSPARSHERLRAVVRAQSHDYDSPMTRAAWLGLVCHPTVGGSWGSDTVNGYFWQA